MIQMLPNLISQRVQPERTAWANDVSQSTRDGRGVRWHTAATGETPPAGGYTSSGPSGHLPLQGKAYLGK